MSWALLKCHECGRMFDGLEPDADEVVRCPECTREAATRLGLEGGDSGFGAEDQSGTGPSSDDAMGFLETGGDKSVSLTRKTLWSDKSPTTGFFLAFLFLGGGQFYTNHPWRALVYIVAENLLPVGLAVTQLLSGNLDRGELLWLPLILLGWFVTWLFPGLILPYYFLTIGVARHLMPNLLIWWVSMVDAWISARSVNQDNRYRSPDPYAGRLAPGLREWGRDDIPDKSQ